MSTRTKIETIQKKTDSDDSLKALTAYGVEQIDLLVSRLDLLESVAEHFPGGLCAFDRDLNMTICNEQLKKLLNYPPELFEEGLPTIEELFQFKANRGEFGPGDVEQHVQSRLRLVAQRQPHRYERELEDGTIIEVRGRPLSGGGFVTTYMDVTKQKTQNKKLEALIESFPGGVCVFDQNYQMIFCNEALKSHVAGSDALFAPGLPSAESYIWHCAKNGDYGAGSTTQITCDRMDSIRNGHSLHTESIAGGKTVVDVNVFPLKRGGFVETRTDVTQERNRTVHLEAILKTYPGGLAVYDKDLQLVLCNEQFKKILDYPENLFARGMPNLEELFYFSARRGEYGEGDVDQIVADRMALARERQPHQFDRTRPDGVELEIRGTPIEDGGFLTTCMDITERVRQQENAIRTANYSAITGLPNRSLFQDRLKIALAQAERGTKIALLNIDIVQFNRFNATAGQQTGDKILKTVADRLLEVKRETDTYAHLGGDAFGVIQIGIDDASGAETLARRLLRTIKEPIELDGRIFELDACIGAAISPDNGTFSDEIQSKAATALHNAKIIGGGMVMFFHSCVNRAYL